MKNNCNGCPYSSSCNDNYKNNKSKRNVIIGIITFILLLFLIIIYKLIST